jgi:hypothetical protein
VAPATQAFVPPAAPAPAAATPPPYDRGTGFEATREAEPESPAPAAPPWASAMPSAPAKPEIPAPVSEFTTPARPAAPVTAASPAPPKAPEPELPALEPEESFDSDATGADDDEGLDGGTVKAAPYRPEADRFGGAGKTPKSLDEFYEDDAYTAGAPSDLMPLTDDESESVGSAPQEIDDDEPAAPWAQPTVEVPLEARAQAAVESAAAAYDDDVFEERPAPPREETAAPAAAPAPPAPAPKTIEVAGFGFGRAEEPPPPAASEPSFRDLAVPAEAPAEKPRSVTSEVPVPVDMVEQIAQRVVAQISEKVIREIAWEVIPDLAEALIRKEIDRLKAEIPKS